MSERNTPLKSSPSRIKRPHLHGIRTNNRSRILKMLRESGSVSRQELAERLDLTPASLSRISKELIAQGICLDAPISRDGSQRGRPSIALQINAEGGYLVAISISSYSRLISIVDIAGQRHYQQEIPKDILHSAASTIDFVGAYVDQLIAEKRLEKSRIIGAAFTIPGSISSQTGFLTKSVLLKWPEFAIKDRLAERLGCPVRVENIGDALCLHFLDIGQVSGKVKPSIFLAHVAAGMGASIAIGGHIVRRLADEGWINDIIVPTTCPKDESKTKLGQLSSGRAILECLSDVNGKLWRSEADFNEKLQSAVTVANHTENVARERFYQAGWVLGANLVPLTIACAPDAIVLAGPVLEASAYYEGAVAGYQQAAQEMDIQPCRIVVSSASYIDAAESLALQDFFFSGAYGL